MIACIGKNLHLGDAIMCCLITYSVSLAEQKKVKVGGCEQTKSIIESMGFASRLDYDSEIDIEPTMSIKSFFAKLNKSNVICLSAPFFYLESQRKLESVTLPFVAKPSQEEITYFQLDNRSSHSLKKSISKNQKINFILKNAKHKLVGIGGKDTKKEMPFPYELGTLEEIVHRMKRASQFLGVDSGMSHVAGVLGVPSKLMVTHKSPKDIKDIFTMYSLLYPKTECVGVLKTFL